jgi:death-on-curing protein
VKETNFPTLEEALYLHTLLLQRYGGTAGIIDLGLLESALGRPRSGHYGTLSLQAAALMHSLVKNHTFVDGNKRMALALTAVFLKMNGYSLKCSSDQAEEFILQLAAETSPASLDSIVTWIESHAHPNSL